MHSTPLSVSNHQRLQLLNEAQPQQPWKTCAEQRRCVACDGVFRGSGVEISHDSEGGVQLGCPGCHSAPDLWVRIGNPLVDDANWAEWEQAMTWFQQHQEAFPGAR